MTNKNKEIEVTILCEDIAHERFIRQYLLCCGFENRKIKYFGNPNCTHAISLNREKPHVSTR
ncbi:MAG: hypothetical protein F6K21_20750 [Symploca sp. SIO2D2]|nr:hypothetical protein [Symploca sp. SIO2D2]